MSNLFSGISGRFRGGGKNNGSKSPGLQGPSPTSPTVPSQSNLPSSNLSSGSNPNISSIPSNQSSSILAPRVPPLPASPSLSQTLSMNESTSSLQSSQSGNPLATYNLPRPLPLWLNKAYASHIVKGNFMTLTARPVTLEQGEWLAHQVYEHFRNLWTFVKVVHDKDDDGTTICNASTCPRMSASANHSFTWLNSHKQPVEVPAHEYISLMQRWISGKIDNNAIFPTDPNTVSFYHNSAGPSVSTAGFASGGLNTPGSNTPIAAGPTTLNVPLSQLVGGGDWIGKSSGFPQDFVEVCQTIFRQMFRVYAHLYWHHFVEPMYHLNLERSMNSCFSHFILTGLELDMLKPSELEPMQPLVDLWAVNGTFPETSKAYKSANLKAGNYLMAIGGPDRY
ncbi:Mob1/phocein [Calycina marina]|uniref:Mob1/phocein n=1 Tax=Calycina marina TaxID=1763456 RepID=A0A9P7Z644_9HELO|nr:Mob1/phocein [Calycina marina]